MASNTPPVARWLLVHAFGGFSGSSERHTCALLRLPPQNGASCDSVASSLVADSPEVLGGALKRLNVGTDCSSLVKGQVVRRALGGW